jgi:hypothetical protein
LDNSLLGRKKKGGSAIYAIYAFYAIYAIYAIIPIIRGRSMKPQRDSGGYNKPRLCFYYLLFESKIKYENEGGELMDKWR